MANANGIANPYINSASQLTSAATQPIGASQINQFMDPYVSDAVNTTSAEINQNNAIQQNQLQGSAASLGALGGNRVGIAQAQLANQQDLAENSTIAGLYNTGYQGAVTNAQTQNSQDLQGAYEYGNLGTTAQNSTLAGANAQLQTGAIEQQQQQNELNQAYSQWEGAQQYPFQEGEYLTNAASSLAGIYGGTSSTTLPAPSTFSQVVGGIGAVAGIAGEFSSAAGAKSGGRIHRDLGGGLPPPPPPYDPNAGDDGSQPTSGGSKGGGGGSSAGSMMKMASMFMNHGGRIRRDLGGVIPNNDPNTIPVSGFTVTGHNSAPPPPAPYDPNAGDDGSKSTSKTGGRIHRDGGGLAMDDGVNTIPVSGFTVTGHNSAPPPPAPYDPNAGDDGSKPSSSSGGGMLKTGGRAGYADGGDIPYQTSAIPAQDLIGNSHHAGYFPAMAFGTKGGNTAPNPPKGYDPNGGDDGGGGMSEQQAQSAASGVDNIENWWDGMDNGIGDSMGGGASDASLVAHQGMRRGGRLARTTGGTTDTTAATTPGAVGSSASSLGGLSATLQSAAPSEGQNIEDYQFISPLIATGRPQAAASNSGQEQSSVLAEEQQEQQQESAVQGKARGGRSLGQLRMKRAAGGGSGGAAAVAAPAALPAYTPVGNATGSAPQPTSTAGSQPTSWGGVSTPTAPMLSSPTAAAPGTGTQASLGTGYNNFAAGYSGSQDPYTAYIASLPGSNPSVKPAAATPAATTTPQQSFFQQLAQDGNFKEKRGGRIGRDIGGPAGLGALPTDAPPSAPAPGLGNVGAPVVSPAPAFGSNPQDFKNFAVRQDQIENGTGNPSAKNPRSSATGDGQFLDSTWLDTARATDPTLTQGKTDQQVLAMRSDPGVSQDLTANLAMQNAAALKSSGIPVTPSNLSLAHRFGATGATKLLTADPNTPVATVLGKDVVAANPDLEGKTAQGAVQSVYSEYAGADGAPGQQTAQNGASDVGLGAVGSPSSGVGSGYPVPLPQLPGGDAGLAAAQQSIDSEHNGVATPQLSTADKIANSPWMALTEAGLGMMAGTSPFAAVNIGRGGLQGMEYLKGIQGQERANNSTNANIALGGQSSQRAGVAQQQQNVELGQAGQNNQVSAANTLGQLALALNQGRITTAQYNWAASQIGEQQVNPATSPSDLGGSAPGQGPNLGGLGMAPPSGTPSYIQSGPPTQVPPQMPTGATGNYAPAGPAQPVGPQSTAPAPQQQPAVAATPQFAQSATGIPAAAPATVDTTMGGPTGQAMPFQQAWQKASAMLANPMTKDMATNWFNQVAPMVNNAGVTELQSTAQTAAQQNTTLTELANEAAQIHTGPVTGPVIAKMVESYDDIRSGLGLPSDPTVTAQSDAAQVIPKLAIAIQSSLGRMASNVGGSEAMAQVAPAIPSNVNTPSGLQQLVRVYGAMNARTQALAQYTNQAVSQRVMTYDQAGQAFNQQYPPAMWASRAMPVPMPPSAAALKPGYAYQANGRAFVWDGSGWSDPQ